MPFLGSAPGDKYQSLAKQTITGDGSTAYTLNRSVTNAYDMEVFINNVRQEPDTSYTASGNTITFTAAVTASDSCYLIYQGQSVGSINPPANSVGSSQVANNTITTAHLHTGLSVPDSNIAAMSASKLTGNVATANMPAGAVLQVISTGGPAAQITQAGAGSVEVINATITPSSTSSKIYIMATSGGVGSGGSNTWIQIQIFRNSTNIKNGPYGGNPTAANAPEVLAVNHLDSPNTTSAITYRLQLERVSSGTNAFNAIAARSTITLMEIKQ